MNVGKSIIGNIINQKNNTQHSLGFYTALMNKTFKKNVLSCFKFVLNKLLKTLCFNHNDPDVQCDSPSFVKF